MVLCSRLQQGDAPMKRPSSLCLAVVMSVAASTAATAQSDGAGFKVTPLAAPKREEGLQRNYRGGYVIEDPVGRRVVVCFYGFNPEQKGRVFLDCDSSPTSGPSAGR